MGREVNPGACDKMAPRFDTTSGDPAFLSSFSTGHSLPEVAAPFCVRDRRNGLHLRSHQCRAGPSQGAGSNVVASRGRVRAAQEAKLLNTGNVFYRV